MKTNRAIGAILLAIAINCWNAAAQAPRGNPLQRDPDVRRRIDLKFPDLIVASMHAGRAAVVDGAVELPLEVVIKNQGNRAAGIFKVSVQYTIPGQVAPVDVAFTVQGQADSWYPQTASSLASGQSITFAGRLRFNPRLSARRISLQAMADSVASDEFLPDFVRVRESDETNNTSVPLWIRTY